MIGELIGWERRRSRTKPISLTTVGSSQDDPQRLQSKTKYYKMTFTFRNNFTTASGQRTRAELLRTSANKTTSTTCRT